MKVRSDYEKVVQIVGRVIRAWDPYCLISEGAPGNEFDDEIARIAARMPHCQDIDEIAKAISDVFSRTFAPEGFSAVACFCPAQEIYIELRREKLVPAA